MDSKIYKSIVLELQYMYITQGRQGELGMWKYLPIPILFIGLMGLNYLLMSVLNLDVAAIMEREIQNKGKNRFFAENMLLFVFFLGGLLFWVKYVHRQSILSLTTSRNKMDWGRVFFVFTLMASFIIISTLIAYFATPGDYQINFEPIPFLILCAIAILLVPIQTSFEEYMFRGYLMQGLGLAVKNKWFPLLLTSVLFGVMHAANPEVEKIGPIIMIYYIGTGLFLGILTLMDEGLELALGFHAANNLVNRTFGYSRLDSPANGFHIYRYVRTQYRIGNTSASIYYFSPISDHSFKKVQMDRMERQAFWFNTINT